jgi:hypothetical protein
MGAEYNNTPRNTCEDYYFQNELPNLTPFNPFPKSNNYEGKSFFDEPDFDAWKIYYNGHSEEKSSELSEIKEPKETKESSNNVILSIQKEPNKKIFELFTTTNIPKKEEEKKFTGKKTGRKPKNESENQKPNKKPFSRKYDMDDIMIKNQVSFFNYSTDCANCLLKEFGVNEKFLPVEHKIKKLATFDNFHSLKQKSIGDIVKSNRSNKYKKYDVNHNKILYENIIKESSVIKNFLDENYITFFQKFYYKGEKSINLEEYGFKGILTLPDNIITHQDKIKSFKEPKYAETYENYVRDLYFKNKVNFHATK